MRNRRLTNKEELCIVYKGEFLFMKGVREGAADEVDTSLE